MIGSGCEHVYVAGPMRGIKDFNFPAFYTATAKLEAAGHFVFNPAERDDDMYGVEAMKGDGDIDKATRDYGFNLREAMSADCEWICTQATAIFMLPGWEKSSGAIAEHSLAKCLRLRLWYAKGAVKPYVGAE
jgi:hypothetical protein